MIRISAQEKNVLRTSNVTLMLQKPRHKNYAESTRAKKPWTDKHNYFHRLHKSGGQNFGENNLFLVWVKVYQVSACRCMKWTSLLLPRVEMDNSRTRFPRDFHPPSPSGNSSRFTPATSKMSSSSSSPSHSDFGLRGPKTPWVCPNDRQLALRAK